MSAYISKVQIRTLSDVTIDILATIYTSAENRQHILQPLCIQQTNLRRLSSLNLTTIACTGLVLIKYTQLIEIRHIARQCCWYAYHHVYFREIENIKTVIKRMFCKLFRFRGVGWTSVFETLQMKNEDMSGSNNRKNFDNQCSCYICSGVRSTQT